MYVLSVYMFSVCVSYALSVCLSVYVLSVCALSVYALSVCNSPMTNDPPAHFQVTLTSGEDERVFLGAVLPVLVLYSSLRQRGGGALFTYLYPRPLWQVGA